MSVDMSGVVSWLKGWFYDKDEIDDIIENLPSGGGGGEISSITLVPYSENPNGAMCYQSSSSSSSSGSVIGTGSFSINNNGHLIVELPNGVSNPYYIDNNGHLIYDTSVGGS